MHDYIEQLSQYAVKRSKSPIKEFIKSNQFIQGSRENQKQ